MREVFVTGANGFIGKALCQKLLNQNVTVHAVVRPGKQNRLPQGSAAVSVGSINGSTDWKGMLDSIDTVVHLAARVHVMHDRTENPFAAYREINVAGTEQLARAAAEAGVKRFVFLSTVKVNGEENVRPYRDTDPPAPKDSYAVSKLQAEELLIEIAKISGMEVVILRPPLVYGPGVKANFLALIKIVAKGLPLPLASIRNRRSLIYLENLVDVITVSCTHPNAGGKVFLVSDGEDVSTPEMIRRIAAALNTSVRLFPCPGSLLFFLGKILGKGPAVDRIIGSLTVDNSKIQRDLSWSPPYSMADGLRKTAEWYLE
jgi:nucleoside-diphosphate-sugar epimerase